MSAEGSPLNVKEARHFPVGKVSTENSQELAGLRTTIDRVADLEKLAREIKIYSEGKQHAAFVVREGDRAIGYVQVDGEEEYLPPGVDAEQCAELKEFAHLARIGVLAEYRGKQVGSELLETAEKWVKETFNDKRGIWLDYLPSTSGLESFYGNAGYESFIEFEDPNKNKIRRIAIKRFE